MADIKDILNDLVPKKGKTKAAVARPLHISAQLLGQYMSGRQKPKAVFYLKWKKVYGEDLIKMTETNVSRENGLADMPEIKDPLPLVSVEDHMNLLKSYNQNMTRIIAENLTILQVNLKIANELLQSIQTSQAAQHSVMFDSLERIEKVAPGTFAAESDRRQIELDRKLRRKGTPVGNGK